MSLLVVENRLSRWPLERVKRLRRRLTSRAAQL